MVILHMIRPLMFAVAIKFIKRTQTTSAVARSTIIPMRRYVVQEQVSSLLKDIVLCTSKFESFLYISKRICLL